MSFERLIRFLDADGHERYGNIQKAMPSGEIIGLQVQVIAGCLAGGFTRTTEKARVTKVII